MNPETVAAVKTSVVTLAGGLVAVVAQIQEWLPETGLIGNLSLFAALALLIGRYTFRQLETYRADLTTAHNRVENLEEDLHQLGVAKAETDKANRELREENHRMRLWILAQGMDYDQA